MHIWYAAVLIFTVFLQQSLSAPEEKQYEVGEPQYKLEAAGGGNSRKNWEANFMAGIGTKVWESKDKQKSLEVGIQYGRPYMGLDGTTYKGPKNYGAGATFKWGRKRRNARV